LGPNLAEPDFPVSEPSRIGLLKPTLEALYKEFNVADSAADPIQVVRRFTRPDDREIVAFCAAALAFGRVTSVLHSVDRLLAVLGGQPAAFVRAFDPRRQRAAFKGFVHRWTRGADLVALIWILKQMMVRSGSIEGFFALGYDKAAADVGSALESFSARALAMDLGSGNSRGAGGPGVGYFFPRPAAGSGCKRLNLFLRWMVRRDALDLGVWSSIAPSKLVIPLDTHVVRVGRCLRLTRYASAGWPMASEITSSLRQLDPDDPVKYDFALCHLGMMNACGFNRPELDARCPLHGVCRPAWRRRRRFRRPSARR
jgi:uncharacterized protein (TIGR02757 family)